MTFLPLGVTRGPVQTSLGLVGGRGWSRGVVGKQLGPGILQSSLNFPSWGNICRGGHQPEAGTRRDSELTSTAQQQTPALGLRILWCDL